MIRLAFRNTRRNVRRTVLTALASFIAVWVVVIILAFMLSMIDDMTEVNVLHMTGHIRVRKAGYSEYEDVQPLQFYIEDSRSLASDISRLDSVRHVERLLRIYVSVYNNGELKNAELLGVDVSDSVFLTGKGANLAQGRLIEDGRTEIVVSPKFLRDFDKTVGDRVTLVTRTASGGTNGASFVIVGVVDANDAQMNGDTVYASIDRMAEITHMDGGAAAYNIPDISGGTVSYNVPGSSGGAIELLVQLYNEEQIPETLADIEDIIKLQGRAAADFEIKSWHEISVLYSMIYIYRIMVVLIEALFFLIASTLIVNTTVMSVMERKKEVSTMAALGFSRPSIRKLFVLEALIISLAGSAAAAVFGKLCVLLTGRYGIDIRMFGADEVEGWGFPKFLYPRLGNSWYFLTVAIMLLVTLLAALLATRRVRKIEIADALRDDR